MADTKEFLGTGRRKTAVARVRLAVGSGKIVVNGRPFENYFPTDTLRTVATQALAATESVSKYDVRINVEGGGPTGQAGAVRHGIARALLHGGRGPAPGAQVGRLPDPRSAHEGAQEVRPARRAQTLPVQQALIWLRRADGGSCDFIIDSSGAHPRRRTRIAKRNRNVIPPIKTAIVGASGYSGEELVRLLLRHPHVELAAVTSRQYAGQTLAQVFPRHSPTIRAAGTCASPNPMPNCWARTAQVVFLALPHGVAAEFAGPLLELGCKVIDLSADFRLKARPFTRSFTGTTIPRRNCWPRSVYGLPEFHRAEIKKATLIASPGCYPTSILLPILPLLKAGLDQEQLGSSPIP